MVGDFRFTDRYSQSLEARTMARLIDADALIDFIDCGHLRNPFESCFSERDVVNMLEARPTVDAVEVVLLLVVMVTSFKICLLI